MKFQRHRERRAGSSQVSTKMTAKQPPACKMIEELILPYCPLQILANKSQCQQGLEPRRCLEDQKCLSESWLGGGFL